MNEQEKELKDILSDFLEKFEMDTYNRPVYLESLSKAIIAKYPQITKDLVFIKREDVIKCTPTDLLDVIFEKYQGKAINIYCEVVE